MSVQDDENRWLVVGLAINKVVVPQTAQFVGCVMCDVHTHLTNTNNVNQQSHTSHLTHYHAKTPNCKFPSQQLHYENINSNASTHKKNSARYDYAVRCPFDLAKLFLKPYMAKSNSLQECDFSALAGIIREVDDSPCNDVLKTVRKEAKDVNELRNMWAHCTFSEWDKAQYRKSFAVMKSLISQLNVTPAVFKELDDWETNGKHR